MWEKLPRKRIRTNVIRIWNYVKKEKEFYPLKKTLGRFVSRDIYKTMINI